MWAHWIFVVANLHASTAGHSLQERIPGDFIAYLVGDCVAHGSVFVLHRGVLQLPNRLGLAEVAWLAREQDHAANASFRQSPSDAGRAGRRREWLGRWMRMRPLVEGDQLLENLGEHRAVDGEEAGEGAGGLEAGRVVRTAGTEAVVLFVHRVLEVGASILAGQTATRVEGDLASQDNAVEAVAIVVDQHEAAAGGASQEEEEGNRGSWPTAHR